MIRQLSIQAVRTCKRRGLNWCTPAEIMRGTVPVRERLDHLIKVARRSKGFKAGTAQSQVQLASMLDLQGEHRQALDLLDGSGAEASELAPQAALLREIASRHLELAESREKLLAAKAPTARRRVRTLSATEAALDLASCGSPCVVRGSGAIPLWSPELLADRLGETTVALRQHARESTLWAGLEPAGDMPFAAFARDFAAEGQVVQPGDPLLFDYPIWVNCPELARELEVPKWFCTDLYSYAQARTGGRSSMPSLFCGAGGAGGGLHIDNMQTKFWMGLCHGRKRWRFVHPSQMPLLQPFFLDRLTPAFPMSLDDVVAKHEAAKAAGEEQVAGLGAVTVYEVMQEPGDIVFVPDGWPHEVVNVETSVAVSCNFVDRGNLDGACAEATLLGGAAGSLPPLAAAMREAEQSGFLSELEASQPNSHLSILDYKRRHGECLSP